MASESDNLKTIRANYIQLLADESAYQVANGPKPSYSIDGETVQWDEWRDKTMARIDALTDQIIRLTGPVLIRSRGRA